MDRTTRRTMAAGTTFAILALSLPSFAADKISTSFVVSPNCILCTFDHITKGNLTMSSTTSAGANGVKFKFSLSGVTKGGLPITSGSQFVLLLRLSVDGGPCDAFQSPQFEIVNGKAKVLFDGSSLVPQPIPEGATSVSFCEVGADLHDTINGSTPARAGLRLGTDPD
jgi:hypothetical protein